MVAQRWEYTFAYARTDPDGVWICPIGEHDVLMSELFASLGATVGNWSNRPARQGPPRGSSPSSSNGRRREVMPPKGAHP